MQGQVRLSKWTCGWGQVTLLEAKVLTERWRMHYNRRRPHSALGYRPPAPETVEPLPPGFATLRPSPRARAGASLT